jgi:hypothetical protein
MTLAKDGLTLLKYGIIFKFVPHTNTAHLHQRDHLVKDEREIITGLCVIPLNAQCGKMVSFSQLQ